MGNVHEDLECGDEHARVVVPVVNGSATATLRGLRNEHGYRIRARTLDLDGLLPEHVDASGLEGVDLAGVVLEELPGDRSSDWAGYPTSPTFSRVQPDALGSYPVQSNRPSFFLDGKTLRKAERFKVWHDFGSVGAHLNHQPRSNWWPRAPKVLESEYWDVSAPSFGRPDGGGSYLGRVDSKAVDALEHPTMSGNGQSVFEFMIWRNREASAITSNSRRVLLTYGSGSSSTRGGDAGFTYLFGRCYGVSYQCHGYRATDTSGDPGSVAQQHYTNDRTTLNAIGLRTRLVGSERNLEIRTNENGWAQRHGRLHSTNHGHRTGNGKITSEDSRFGIVLGGYVHSSGNGRGDLGANADIVGFVRWSRPIWNQDQEDAFRWVGDRYGLVCPNLRPREYNSTVLTDGSSGWRGRPPLDAAYGDLAWHRDQVNSVCLSEVNGQTMTAVLGHEGINTCSSGYWAEGSGPLCSLTCPVRTTPSAGGESCDNGVHVESFASDPDGGDLNENGLFLGYEHFPQFPGDVRRQEHFGIDTDASHAGVVSQVYAGGVDSHGVVKMQSRPSTCEFESRPMILFPSKPAWESRADLVGRAWVRLTSMGSSAGLALRVQQGGQQFYTIAIRAPSGAAGLTTSLGSSTLLEAAYGGRSAGLGGLEVYRSVEDRSGRKNPNRVGIAPLAPARYPLDVTAGDNDENAVYSAEASAVSPTGANRNSTERFVPVVGRWYLIEAIQLQKRRPGDNTPGIDGGIQVNIFDAR